MKKINKTLNILFIMILSIFLFSCHKEDNKVVVTKIIVDDSLQSEICLDDFNLDYYKLFVFYSDGSLKTVNLDESMILESDLIKLSTLGKHKINISYDGFYTSFELSLVEELENNLLKLSILELNDIHGYIEQNDKNQGGLSNTAYEINKIRNETKEDDVVLIANGDMFQGTAISNTTYGLSVLEAMNEMGFDAMGIGNHEFDWGLDKITKYFDGDESNGEANFPLLNANIMSNSTSELLLNKEGRMFDYTIVEKEGINVGIVSFIGDVSSSINYRFYLPYTILTNVEKLGTSLCATLKDQGADVIIVNIHGGNSKGVNDYEWNKIFANIRYNNEYAVDAIINGHTHTLQDGYIERLNGLKVPVVQSSGNNASFGRIDLSINLKQKDVIDVSCSHHYPSKTNYDNDVEEVVEKYLLQINNEKYCIAGETVNDRYSLCSWITNVLKSATDADIAIINKGAIRSNGGIVKGEYVTISNIYQILPFNNEIITIELKGSEIYYFLRKSSIVYSSSIDIESLKSNQNLYKIAVVDYVYYYDDFPKNSSSLNQNIYMTDLLIEDVKLRDVFSPITDSKAYLTFNENA